MLIGPRLSRAAQAHVDRALPARSQIPSAQDARGPYDMTMSATEWRGPSEDSTPRRALQAVERAHDGIGEGRDGDVVGCSMVRAAASWRWSRSCRFRARAAPGRCARAGPAARRSPSCEGLSICRRRSAVCCSTDQSEWRSSWPMKPIHLNLAGPAARDRGGRRRAPRRPSGASRRSSPSRSRAHEHRAAGSARRSSCSKAFLQVESRPRSGARLQTLKASSSAAAPTSPAGRGAASAPWRPASRTARRA